MSGAAQFQTLLKMFLCFILTRVSGSLAEKQFPGIFLINVFVVLL